MGDAREALRFVAGLPFERWAVQLSTGQADLRGQLQPTPLRVGGHTLHAHGGTAHLELLFVGGRRPVLAAISLTTVLSYDGRPGRHLRVVQGEIAFDDQPLPRTNQPLASGELVTAILDNLHNVELSARARPADAATVRLPEGIEVQVTDRDELSVRVRTHGAPNNLHLATPLDLRFGHHGVHIDHRSARWLSRLARVRILGAELHPDGRVVLQGGAGRGFDRVLRGGLRSASSQLSQLVRKSPRFARVREFLR